MTVEATVGINFQATIELEKGEFALVFRASDSGNTEIEPHFGDSNDATIAAAVEQAQILAMVHGGGQVLQVDRKTGEHKKLMEI